MKAKIRVAVIGAGNMGRHHVRNYAELDGAELVAVADANPAIKDMAEQFGVAYFQDWREMLDKAQPEAVSVVVPTPLHFAIGQEVMQRGIHCLMEKPIASTVEEADELISTSREYNVVFTVGHIERFNPVVRKLKEIITKKELGDITSIVCRRVGGLPIVEPKTDVIVDLAVHDIDIMNFLLGHYPLHVSSHGSRTRHSRKVDAAEILLHYKGTSGFVQANWITPVKVRNITVTGSKGYISANYLTQKLHHYQHNVLPDGAAYEQMVAVGEPNKKTIEVEFKEPLKLELKAFLAAIRGKRSRDFVDPISAREALRLALSASAQSEMVAVTHTATA